MNPWERFKVWLNDRVSDVMFALSIDMRVFDDPAITFGGTLLPETKELIAKAKVHAGMDLFGHLKVGDPIMLVRPNLKGDGNDHTPAEVSEVKETTVKVKFLADIYRTAEFRKRDGSNILNDRDYGWLEHC